MTFSVLQIKLMFFLEVYVSGRKIKNDLSGKYDNKYTLD